MPDTPRPDAMRSEARTKARRIDLGRFLRAARGRLRPADVKVSFPGRRHVRGLRRDEVASLAGIGLSWYTMLEQGRVENVSTRTLLALAQALQLSAQQREHLFTLAAGAFEEIRLDETPPPRHLVEWIRAVTAGMAFIVSPRFDVAAYNAAADAFFRFSAHGAAPNLLRIMVVDPLLRERFIDPDWEAVATSMVGHFRLWAARVGDARFDALVAELMVIPAFSAIWHKDQLVSPPSERSRLWEPERGPFTVNVMAFTCFNCPTFTIILKTAVDPDLDQIPPPDAVGGAAAAPRRAGGRDRRGDLGAFLRQRREALTPEDIGMARTGRRHAKGLRRDEVADRAGIGASWYTMLEQGRVENVSMRTLRAVADALLLSHRERLYLERLSFQSFTEFHGYGATPGADLVRLIERFPDGQTHFHDAHFNMIAWNPEGDAFYGFSHWEHPNLLQIMVRNAHLRGGFVRPNWGEALQRMLAHYRFTNAIFCDSDSEGLVAELARESDDFRVIWESHQTVSNPGVEPGELVFPNGDVHRVHVLLLTPTTVPTHTWVVKARAGRDD